MMDRNETTVTVLVLLAIGAGGTLIYLKRQKAAQDSGANAFYAEIEKKLSSEAIKANYFGTAVKCSSNLLATTAANQYAKDIYSSWGIWDDDEDKIKATLRKIKTLGQMAQVAKAYEAMYKTSLLTDFETKLSDAEYTEMEEIMKGKPRC